MRWAEPARFRYPAQENKGGGRTREREREREREDDARRLLFAGSGRARPWTAEHSSSQAIKSDPNSEDVSDACRFGRRFDKSRSMLGNQFGDAVDLFRASAVSFMLESSEFGQIRSTSAEDARIWRLRRPGLRVAPVRRISRVMNTLGAAVRTPPNRLRQEMRAMHGLGPRHRQTL